MSVEHRPIDHQLYLNDSLRVALARQVIVLTKVNEVGDCTDRIILEPNEAEALRQWLAETL